MALRPRMRRRGDNNRARGQSFTVRLVPVKPVGRFATEPLEKHLLEADPPDECGHGGVPIKEPHVILHSGMLGTRQQRIGRLQPTDGQLRATNGDGLTFSQMATTMMACLEGKDTEQAFLEALGSSAQVEDVGQHLKLFDAAGNLVARFEARHEVTCVGPPGHRLNVRRRTHARCCWS